MFFRFLLRNFEFHTTGCPSVEPKIIEPHLREQFVEEGKYEFGPIHELQFGVSRETLCVAWVFNLYLSPGCSCYYLLLRPLRHSAENGDITKWETCDSQTWGNEKSIKPLLPYIEDVRFLYFEQSYLGCALNDMNLDLIGSWEYLRVIRLVGDNVTAFPDSWQHLTSLVSIELQMSRMNTFDKDMVSNWPLLESLVCKWCPHLTNLSGLRDASLPRLTEVEVHGAHECTSLNKGRETRVICVGYDATQQCPGIPEWYLRGTSILFIKTKLY